VVAHEILVAFEHIFSIVKEGEMKMPLKFLSFGSLCFFLVSITLSLLSPMPCLSQVTDTKDNLKISVQLYYLPEREACRDNEGRPKGYAPRPKPSHCKPWNMDEIKSLSGYMIDEKKDIPPIKLSGDLNSILWNYVNMPIKTDENKNSILLVITIDPPPNSNSVTLERIVPKEDCEIGCYYPHRTIKYDLVGNHLIHHERADAFAPWKEVTWKLTIGKYPPCVLSTTSP
jgi:hypothetical protein